MQIQGLYDAATIDAAGGNSRNGRCNDSLPQLNYDSLRLNDGGSSSGGERRQARPNAYDGGEIRNNDSNSSSDIRSVISPGLYLNRFMDPEMIVQSLRDAAATTTTTSGVPFTGSCKMDVENANNDPGCSSTSDKGDTNTEQETSSSEDRTVRQLIVDGIDLGNDLIRNAFVDLFETCDHDWHCIEFKSCVGPIHPIIRSLLGGTGSSSSSGVTDASTTCHDVDMEETQGGKEDEQEGSASIVGKTTRTVETRTVHQLRLIGITLDENLTDAISDGLSLSGNPQSPSSSSSPLSESTDMMTTPQTGYRVLRLMMSGTMVMWVNVMALRHGEIGSDTNRYPLLEGSSSSQSRPSNNQNDSTMTEVDCDGDQVMRRSCDNVGGFLKKLDIFSCDLSDEQIAKLINTIQQGRHPVEELDLGKNQCVFHGLAALDRLLWDDHSTIKWLNLFFQQHRNQPPMNTNSSPQMAFGQGPQINSTQPEQQQRQQQDQPNPLDVSRFANGLAMNRSLETLILRGNKLSDDGVDFLASALQLNGTLRKLNLTDCCISRAGIQSFFFKVFGGGRATVEYSQMRMAHSTSSSSISSSRSQLQKVWLDGGQLFGTGGTGGRVAARKEVLRWLESALEFHLTLEELYLPFSFFEDMKNSKQTTYWLDLNRGGRKLITNGLLPPPTPVILPEDLNGTNSNEIQSIVSMQKQEQCRHIYIPIALWPHVLERVNTMTLFNSGIRHRNNIDAESKRYMTCRRNNVMYALVRDVLLSQAIT